MADNKISWYEWVQAVVLILTMCMMLSKHYHAFEVVFHYLYEGTFGWAAVILGGFSVVHGMYMVFKAFVNGQKIRWREFIEAIIVIACGFVLLSPDFNSVLTISFLELHIPDDVISHLAFGLVPIIVIYIIDIIRGETD